MSSWKYLSNEDKQKHELYNKKTALDLFFLYLKVQFVFSVLGVFSAYSEYSQSLRKYNYQLPSDFSGGKFFLISLIPSIFLLIFLILFSKYGKSKTTVQLLITLLISLPIVSTITSFFIATTFKTDLSAASMQMVTIFMIFIIFGIVFAIYSFFSKPFNLQYLNKVKI